MSAMLSISEAAKHAGISRTTLYKKYIDTGVITVQRINDLPRIDVADLIRVFGNVNMPSSEQKLTEEYNVEQALNNKINELERKVEKLKIENDKLLAINEAQERHLSDMRRSFELLEHHKQPRKRFLGLF